MRDLLKREMRASVRRLRQIHLDDAYFAAEFPRQRQMARRIAAGDPTARIALQLIAPAEAKIA